jgi:hypothetical protein
MQKMSLKASRTGTLQESHDHGSPVRHPYTDWCQPEQQELFSPMMSQSQSQHDEIEENEQLPLHPDEHFEYRIKLIAPTDDNIRMEDLNQIDPLPLSSKPLSSQEEKKRKPDFQSLEQQSHSDYDDGNSMSYVSPGLPRHPSTQRFLLSSLRNVFNHSTTALASSTTSDIATAGAAAATNATARKVDRRRIFAKMKVSRPASGRFDSAMSNRSVLTERSLATERSLGTEGTPSDVYNAMLDSQFSLMSNLSAGNGVGLKQDVSKRMLMEFSGKTGARDPIGNCSDNLKREDFMMAIESRRSLLSGLSKISDSSDVMSFISDLSRKIGNVSTRSIAMSEISGIEEEYQEDLEDLEEESHSNASQGGMLEEEMVE